MQPTQQKNIFSCSDGEVCLYEFLFFVFIIYSVVKQYQMKKNSSVSKYVIDFMQFKNKGLTLNFRDMKLIHYLFILFKKNFFSISYENDK